MIFQNNEFLFSPIRTPIIQDLLKDLPSSIYDNYSTKDKNWLIEYSNDFIKKSSIWLSKGPNVVSGLNDDWHAYIINGSIDGLNIIFNNENKRIVILPRDNDIYTVTAKMMGRSIKAIYKHNLKNYLTTEDLFIASRPHAWSAKDEIDQVVVNIIRLMKTTFISDLTLLGTTSPMTINLNDTSEYCLISFSEILGMPNLRLGILFSRKPIGYLEMVKEACLLNTTSINIVSYLIDHITNGHLYETYINAYKKIITEMKLLPSNSIFYGYHTETRQSVGLSKQLENYVFGDIK